MLFLFYHVKAAAKATDLIPFLITYRFFLSGSEDLGRGPWRGRSVFLSVNMSAESFSDDHPGSCRYSLRLFAWGEVRGRKAVFFKGASGQSSFCPCPHRSQHGLWNMEEGAGDAAVLVMEDSIDALEEA